MNKRKFDKCSKLILEGIKEKKKNIQEPTNLSQDTMTTKMIMYTEAQEKLHYYRSLGFTLTKWVDVYKRRRDDEENLSFFGGSLVEWILPEKVSKAG